MSTLKINDILVIGSGPTGVAALFKAKLEGLNAIAVEAGISPLSSLCNYPSGMILSSPANHFEIVDIPLDCKNFEQVSKEELLHYYTRIINFGQLQINPSHTLISIKKKPRYLEASCKTKKGVKKILAKNIIFTAWYKPRLIRFRKTKNSNIKIYYTLPNLILLANQHVIILGGGVSACEAAIMLMLAGFTITVIIRGKKTTLHDSEAFVHLISITKSTIVYEASDLSLGRDCIKFKASQRRTSIQCNSLIACVGQEIDMSPLRVLTKKGVISASQISKLQNAVYKTYSNKPLEPLEELLLRADSWVNFYHQFVHGVDGIRVVGAALHLGASAAGIRVSIHTAVEAVNLIKKGISDAIITDPLPRCLMKWAFDQTEKPSINLKYLKEIRPTRVSSWTRTSAPVGSLENEFGFYSNSKKVQYYLGATANNKYFEQILKLSDGTNNVEQILNVICEDESELPLAIETLFHLFYNNGLSWLPPKHPHHTTGFQS